MVKFKKTALSVVSLGMAACLSTSIAAVALASTNTQKGASTAEGDAITRLNTSVDNHTADYFDGNIVTRLSDKIGSNQEISVILSLDTKSTFDGYLESGSKGEFSDYLTTASAKNLAKKNRAASDELRKALDRAKVSYKMGVSYENVISGFEVLLRAKDYNKLLKAVGNKATAIVGEVYAPAEAEIVTNDVDVYETGIFDSSSCKYQGDGVLVAVLDTGLDYTHTAFDPNNFTTDNEAFTLSTITEKIRDTEFTAEQTTANLTAEDVYINKKVPFAYDYADKDADVFPLNSEHGTHVAGVIAGKDDRITGVAPNAQLAIMKVFSDSDSGARTSWLIAALEDCVALGVDVINMSLGSTAGFTTQDDEEKVQAIYNKVKKAGISLITAAGNEDCAASGSEKNGNNPLTSNPDSGSVGSPSTYEAALSVASVGGVKTPYFVYQDEIMYFTEASTSSAKNKSFVNDILGDKESQDFEYVTISGVGRRADYTESREYYQGKIVLVKRGETTFEEKVDIALRIMKAAGIIIYNNVSGSISMSVGADIGAVCSITQDQGEKLAAAKTGILKISKSQVAGPFMSDFSNWGPTSDLRIKPEITAHGGEILSAVPGQGYDRLSGTSMASPNMAGAAALIRQYVKENPAAFGLGEESAPDNAYAINVTNRVNQLAMSTADIVRNKNGLAYAVRKQGAGLVNITKATTAAAYISTFENGKEMDKTKLELGDDKDKTGVYTMSFNINNITDKSVSYNIGSIVMTEGVSSAYTGHGETTVTKDGYLLSAATKVVSVENGQQSGSTVTVGANGSAKVTVEITLSDADKAYLDKSFEYGMYVEGYITLKASAGTQVDLNVPYLAFYGDWTEAPIFDEEYYDTNADELNDGINANDKLMADAYATRVIGGYYTDYIAPLGTYPFVQNPSATKIAASKDHIALSNYENGESSSLNKINSIAAGLLRNVKEWKLTIVEDSTGKKIWETSDRNQRKSTSNGGSTIYQSSMDVGFSVFEHNLKNNTKYTVTVETYIDYGAKEDQKNARNTFTFPLYIDFEAPLITGVDYRTEYDQSTKKTRLYADVNIYDNHYAMGVQFGRIIKPEDPGSTYLFSMDSFGKYITPVYSSYNSTSKVTFELTDYVNLIKQSRGIRYDTSLPNGYEIVENNNSFLATCYDYAMNSATYEIRLPDEVIAMYFDKSEEVKLSPNETLDLTSKLHIFPADTWAQVLDFKSSDTNIVDIVNQTAIAKMTGMGRTATVTATGKDAKGNPVSASIEISVRDGNDPDYKDYDAPLVSKAEITKYKTNKAFYFTSSSERDIGVTNGAYFFGNNYNLSMYPSESVSLVSDIQTYFSNCKKEFKYSSSRPEIASVDKDGTILALAKGSTSINVSVDVTYLGKTTSQFVGTVNITVKDPYTTNSIYLMSYKGLGGEVVIPGDRGFTTIQSYAFSGYDFVDKDLDAGDVIDDEDPYYIKQMYLGEDTITKVVIPEGVTTIEAYAFANLTALKEVVLPSTLTKIGVGAFLGCRNLTKINLENVQFINERAFMGCQIKDVKFDKIVAIGSYAFGQQQVGTNQFVRNQFKTLTLPASAQSLDSGAFFGITSLTTVNFASDQIKIKLGEYVFAYCSNLTKISVNAAVIPTGAFYRCVMLSDVTLGRDVAIIGDQAFAGSNVASFKLAARSSLTVKNGGAYVYNKDGVLILVAPKLNSSNLVLDDDTTSVASGAFAGNASIVSVTGANVTTVEPYAFADCPNLVTVKFPKLTTVGEYAFFNAEKLTIIDKNSTESEELNRDQFALVTSIGAWAFAGTAIEEVKIADGATIGEYAFAQCSKLEKVMIGNNVAIGRAAFFAIALDCTYASNPGASTLETYYTKYEYPADGVSEDGEKYTYYHYNFEKSVQSSLTDLKIGDNVKIGDYAFRNAAKIENFTLGTGAVIGAYAFYDATGVKIDPSTAVSIGEGAFTGSRDIDLWERTIDGQIRYYYAYERALNANNQVVIVDYKYSYYAPTILADADGFVDLSALTSIGDGAFAFNQSVEKVKLPANLTAVPAYLFAQCYALEEVEIPTSVTEIGEYAFANTEVELDLSANFLSKVGESAFRNGYITAVSFADGAAIADSAFYNCADLAIVNGLNKVAKIGAWAFAGTAIEEADLTGATEIGDFAFALSKLTKVTFVKEVVGEDGKNTLLLSKLEEIGENPFFGCEIASFARTAEEKVEGFGLTVTKEIYTYDVNDGKTIKVINNVLYKEVPNGLQLVCYPAAATDTAYTVEENTVRIGARAFYGASLVNVTLPRTLKAIGDKAFFGCLDLTTVIFNSFEAPILEEEFDESYIQGENLPLSGNYEDYTGLGIAGYYMWNSTDAPNFYYGANFVYYIGRFTPDLVMVSPANGTGYDTFIFEKYFGTFTAGGNAITDDTLKVIEMIAKLNANITLADQAAVEAARLAYEALPNLEQKALVTNYTKLTSAENTIEFLLLRQEPTTPTPSGPDKNNGSVNALGIAGFTVAGVLLLVLAAFAAYVFLGKKKEKTAELDSTETVNEDEASDDKDNNDNE